VPECVGLRLAPAGAAFTLLSCDRNKKHVVLIMEACPCAPGYPGRFSVEAARVSHSSPNRGGDVLQASAALRLCLVRVRQHFDSCTECQRSCRDGFVAGGLCSSCGGQCRSRTGGSAEPERSAGGRAGVSDLPGCERADAVLLRGEGWQPGIELAASSWGHADSAAQE
jgi:hypothetical protein